MTLITKTILEIPDLDTEPDTPESGTAYAYVYDGTFTVKLDDDSTKSLQISDITAGDGITIDRTDPANPVISADDSGHTILDPDGTALAQEAKLQFLGNVLVTDDSSAGSTKVTVAGEGPPRPDGPHLGFCHQNLGMARQCRAQGRSPSMPPPVEVRPGEAHRVPAAQQRGSVA
jgi:hypothetical protein